MRDARLFASLSLGVAAARVVSDPQNATASLSNALTTLLKGGTSFVALLGYLFCLNWRLALGARSYESQARLTGIVDDIARAWCVPSMPVISRRPASPWKSSPCAMPR